MTCCPHCHTDSVEVITVDDNPTLLQDWLRGCRKQGQPQPFSEHDLDAYLYCFECQQVLTQKIHQIKIAGPLYPAVERRQKTAEVRNDDRNYQVGDALIISPALTQDGANSRCCTRVITHKVPGGQFGIEAGYCLLSMQ